MGNLFHKKIKNFKIFFGHEDMDLLGSFREGSGYLWGGEYFFSQSLEKTSRIVKILKWDLVN